MPGCGVQGVGGTCSAHSSAYLRGDCRERTGNFLRGTSPVCEHSPASAVGCRLVAQRRARGRRFTSPAWDVFRKVGICCWGVSLEAGVPAGCFSSVPHPVHRAISWQALLTCAVPGCQRPPAPDGRPLLGLPRLEAVLGWSPASPSELARVIPSIPLCARRGGPQRRPVPKRSRGADQLPVHGAHVPLRRGPGAYAEGHGRSWCQQVGCSCWFKLLNWSRLLSGQRRGSAHHPDGLLLASAGPLQLGRSFPPPHALGNRQPWSDGPSSQEDFAVSCSGQRHPAQPFPPGAGLAFGFMCAFSCA